MSAINQIPITTGMRIQLRHLTTQGLLKSLGKKFRHPGSSEQQMVVATTESDQSTIWIVRTPHGSNGGAQGVPIKHRRTIRLEHSVTRKHLHSHANVPAPIERDQQEVTAFGEHGNGDQNDDWVIDIPDPNELKVWSTNMAVRLRHKNSNTNLHSHHRSDPIFTDGYQEVTTYRGHDDNDLWEVEVAPEPFRDDMRKSDGFSRARSEFGQFVNDPDSPCGPVVVGIFNRLWTEGENVWVGISKDGTDGTLVFSQRMLYLAAQLESLRPESQLRTLFQSEDLLEDFVLNELQNELIDSVAPGVRSPIGPSLSMVAKRASEIRQSLGNDSVVEIRHLYFALLEAQCKGRSLERAPFGNAFNLDAVIRRFKYYLSENRWVKEYGESEGWSKILVQLTAPTEAPVKSDEPARSPYVDGPAGYSPEFCSVGNNLPTIDRLDVDKYANRLAELIALRETKLPLAIGLFGNWGSGKTHFMNLIDQHLRSLAAREDNPSTSSQGRWCTKIVPIYFNAWHYHDANLWASLVTEIFDGLFKRFEKKEDQRALLQDRLNHAGGATARAEEEVAIAQTAVKTASLTLTAARKAHNKAEEIVSGMMYGLKSLIPEINNPENRKKVIEWLGVSADEATLSSLTKRRDELLTLTGALKAMIQQVLQPNGRAWRLTALAVRALFLPAVALIATHYSQAIKEILEAIGPVMNKIIAVIVGLAAAMGPYLATLLVELKKMTQWQREAKEAQTQSERVRQINEAKKEVMASEGALAAAEARLAAAQAVESQLKLATDALHPERRLREFIESRAKSSDYRGQLGLVSLARRDFRELSLIFADAGALNDVTSDLGKGQKEALKTLGDSIDRVVLFVDDLDRCQPEKVVEILQAVHLLLAFPLFAVVVGVDQRCLRQSLRSEFKGLMTPEKSPDDAKHMEEERPATPLDYLEKIFHVPFHLPEMQKDGFSSLVDHLAGKSEPKVLDVRMVESVSITDQSTAEVISNSMAQATDPDLKKAIAFEPGNMSAKSAERGPVKGSVPLEDWERKAFKDYYRLIATPRGVTRFLNTYRLVRAGVPQSEWNEFRGDEALHGEFRIAMLLLAAAAGQPRLAREWFHALRETSPSILLISDEVVGPDPREWEKFKTAFDATIVLVTVKTDSEMIVKWLDRIERYTF